VNFEFRELSQRSYTHFHGAEFFSIPGYVLVINSMLTDLEFLGPDIETYCLALVADLEVFHSELQHQHYIFNQHNRAGFDLIREEKRCQRS
jgi:hypothetical protein